jgi:hypothetical protein
VLGLGLINVYLYYAGLCVFGGVYVFDTCACVVRCCYKMCTPLEEHAHVYKNHAPISHQMLTCVYQYYHDMGTRGGGWLVVLLVLVLALVKLVPRFSKANMK